jgi:hypothetical protein
VQNVTEFKAMLAKALAIDIDADPSNRLANTLARRRAKWLFSRLTDLVLESAPRAQ